MRKYRLTVDKDDLEVIRKALNEYRRYATCMEDATAAALLEVIDKVLD